MKKVAVLGSTGSIGTQTLDVVRANDDLEVVGLAAGSNVEMLEKQIREFHPRLVAVWKEEAARDLAVRVQDLDVKIVSQMGGLIELARMEESDILVTAIVGMIGIRPTMEAILAGKDIALANKETLVTAGHLIMPLAKQFVTVAAHTPRAMPAETLAEHIRVRGGIAEPAPSIEAGVARAVELGGSGPVCALGTLYFSGEVRRAFEQLCPLSPC